MESAVDQVVITPIPSAGPLRFSRPASFCFGMLACAAAGLAYPTQGDLRWLDATCQDEPDGSPEFFCPYAIVGSGVALKPWAHRAYRYVGCRENINKKPASALEPEDWRYNLENLIADLQYVSPAVWVMVRQMQLNYLSPEDAQLAWRDAMDKRVWEAAQTGRLIIDPKRAAKAIELTKVTL